MFDGIDHFDDQLHQMPSKEHKGLVYYFRYVKKNLFLIAAVDKLPGLYDDQNKAVFEELHTEVQRCAQSNFREMGKLTYSLTVNLSENMRRLNPKCKEELEWSNS